jgi:hypothetical protein
MRLKSAAVGGPMAYLGVGLAGEKLGERASFLRSIATESSKSTITGTAPLAMALGMRCGRVVGWPRDKQQTLDGGAGHGARLWFFD